MSNSTPLPTAAAPAPYQAPDPAIQPYYPPSPVYGTYPVAPPAPHHRAGAVAARIAAFGQFGIGLLGAWWDIDLRGYDPLKMPNVGIASAIAGWTMLLAGLALLVTAIRLQDGLKGAALGMIVAEVAWMAGMMTSAALDHPMFVTQSLIWDVVIPFGVILCLIFDSPLSEKGIADGR